jgi:hypothetical protein
MAFAPGFRRTDTLRRAGPKRGYFESEKNKPPVYPTGGLFYVAFNWLKLVVALDHFSKQKKHDGSVKDNHADH